MGLVHDRAQLIHGEGRDVVEHAARLHTVAAVGIDLDPVHAIGDLFSYGLTAALRAVHLLHTLGPLQLPRITKHWIRPSHVHRTPRDLHARAWYHPSVDRFLDVRIGVASAFGFQIANRGEAISEGTLRGNSAKNRPIGRGVLQDLHVVVFGGDITLQ